MRNKVYCIDYYETEEVIIMKRMRERKEKVVGWFS